VNTLADRLKIDQIKKEFYFRKTIKRSELKEFYIKFYPQLKETTFRWMLYDLKKEKIIIALDRGIFTLYDCEKDDCLDNNSIITKNIIYQPIISPKLEEIYSRLRQQFPYLNICVWETSWLNEFMVHQPGRFFTIIEVENGTEEPVFYYLKSAFENVYIKPTSKELEWYIFESKESIVIKKLVSQAPITKDMSIIIPRAEKILVDLFAEKDFFYPYQGQELINIFENMFRYYKISLPSLYRYAGRRKCKQRLESFIKEQMSII
jgi:hypothetical protein